MVGADVPCPDIVAPRCRGYRITDVFAYPFFERLLKKGAGRIPAKDVVAPSDADHAATVLEDSLGATLLHKNLKAEIETPIAEVKALR